MIFSYNWLQSFFAKKLPKPEQLAEVLTLHFAEVEEVRKEKGDYILNIDVRPNRAADCFSHLGIAREIAAILGLKFQIPDYRLKEDKNLKSKDFVSVEIKDKKACPRYTAKVITDIKVGPSPEWLQKRLIVCGLRPINNIVDVVNYVMLETGQPLHTFDGEKLEGEKIIVRFAQNSEKITTLDGDAFTLDPEVLVIADAKNPVAIAGIKGGKTPEISRKTRIVVIESANFNPRVIRRGSKKINLKTDASVRFEHGLDPNMTEIAINRSAYLMEKIAQGKIAQGLVDVYPQKVFPKIVKLDLNYIERLLGIKIPEKEVKNILERLGFKIKTKKGKFLNIEIPTRRLDVSLSEDLIEDIGRIYGYKKIGAVYPISALIPPRRNLDIFWEDAAKNALKEAGFNEVYNYSFFGEKEAKLFDFTKKGLIEVENPLSNEQKYLRISLIPNLLKNVEKNLRQFPDIKIFELGKVFKSPNTEKRMLAGLLVGDNFYQLKGVVDSLLNSLGISSIWYDDYQAGPEETKLSVWHPQKSAEIKINGEEIGFLGEISHHILSGLTIPAKVVLFDIDFEKLNKSVSEEQEYRPISKFPSAIRDIAVLVPRQIRVEEVLNKIEEGGGTLIRDVDLFDMYEGAGLPEDRKNLAFHIIFQAENRTLSSEEIDKIQQKIIKTLEKNPGWQVRK
ncbi:MAG: phenylalanine--tRNA ligase subunit beta [Candidatus Nealsonbacteria bacterium RBG_13_42_11]|uniref:Phenylalanine--tRNA ligase beta subunit n=1 Tax=Candidatus Nealsonbacteria bacterium RBG_13_42_11 TaxID=1801663 RepID=A0A1G2DZ51_9BACT|nr:MAG: phenylalanine--tRNA ligase subunit beta [Candidatus Nealsonbacteria bacterium RBG_13_42_11]